MILYHPAFCERGEDGETGMLTGLAFSANANEAALASAKDILPACAPCPVAVGACATDPSMWRLQPLLEWKEAGVEGLCNFPTVGLADGLFREDLEADEMGFSREVQCMAEARRMGMFTVGLACHPDDASSLRMAGCDVLILHLGLDAAAMPRGLASSDALLPPYLYAIRGGNGPSPLLLLHGDALAGPADEAAASDLVGSGSPWDGIFAAGGPERIRFLRSICSWADS
jgi:predicted TIM-barrel enzyme